MMALSFLQEVLKAAWSDKIIKLRVIKFRVEGDFDEFVSFIIREGSGVLRDATINVRCMEVFINKPWFYMKANDLEGMIAFTEGYYEVPKILLFLRRAQERDIIKITYDERYVIAISRIAEKP